MTATPDIETQRGKVGVTYDPSSLRFVHHDRTKTDYNPTKHITAEDALGLNLPPSVLDTVPNYSDGRKTFHDRIDIGLVVDRYHASLNGRPREGLTMDRSFTLPNQDPFNSVGPYEQRRIVIYKKDGSVKFEMDDALVPQSWGDASTKMVAEKYCFKPREEEWQAKLISSTGKPYEHSPKHVFSRVSSFFGEWGQKLGYFKTDEDRQAFEDELNFLQINQMFAFNSPVYFNAGIHTKYGIPGSRGMNFVKDTNTDEVKEVSEGFYVRPQCHACFIMGPEDNLESLLQQNVAEGGIFAGGSGVGLDLSHIRAEGEPLSSGGVSSGAMSFFEVWDRGAGVVKSGGKNRRAARMTTMGYHHPDIMKFIQAKRNEDYKALILMQNGDSADFEGDAYKTVSFQNTNLTVRVDDEFYKKVGSSGDVDLIFVKSGEIAGRISARKMLEEISFAAWRIGDPGMQFVDKIQEMNTGKNSGQINSSNPCSEYMYLDNTACNLGSLNLIKFADDGGRLDILKFQEAIRVVTIAHDIANIAGSYPVREIADISPRFSTIGLGYANLGALFMRKGIPYDSEKARTLASAITAILTGTTYERSAELAAALGPFEQFEFNREPMMDVMNRHRTALDTVKWENIEDKIEREELERAAHTSWDRAIEKGSISGFRNAQATVIAPTGTIRLLMDCDSGGIEPVYALLSTKRMAGGGILELPTQEVPNALKNLGYKPNQIEDIVHYIDRHKGKIEGAPHLNPDHYAVFDTAVVPQGSSRTIHFEGHVKMLGAAQPWISGAISKTNNLPHSATVKDIYDGFILAHQLGLKALAVFRDDSKPVQVMTVGNDNPYRILKRGEQEEVPQTSFGPKIKIEIGGVKHHIRFSEYEDGRLAEIFIDAAKYGSAQRGWLHQFAISASKALQIGMSLDDWVDAHINMEFEPRGFTNHPWIPEVKSPVDAVARLVAIHYLGKKEFAADPDAVRDEEIRGHQTGAVEVYKRQDIDEWNIEDVLQDPVLGGFPVDSKTNPPKDEKDNHKNATKSSKTTGNFCRNCGDLLRQISPNCYECINCTSTFGGCG